MLEIWAPGRQGFRESKWLDSRLVAGRSLRLNRIGHRLNLRHRLDHMARMTDSGRGLLWASRGSMNLVDVLASAFHLSFECYQRAQTWSTISRRHLLARDMEEPGIIEGLLTADHPLLLCKKELIHSWSSSGTTLAPTGRATAAGHKRTLCSGGRRSASIAPWQQSPSAPQIMRG